MNCPNCNHENPDSNKFCAECGTKLEVNPSIIVCPKCHSQVPADSKFCPDCGTPITLYTECVSRNIDKASTFMKLLTLGDFKIGDNIYDVECEDYTKIDDDGWGFKVIKASIDDDGFEYIARVRDKRIFALAIDLAECENSIPENWKEIGIKDNNIQTSFEKVLSRLNFDWEDIDSPGDGISFISSTKWNGENIFIVGSNSAIVISLLDDETKANIYAAIKEDLVDETNESKNDDDELPSCPKCGSDDVDDDGSDYLQYMCNDCGHNWGHDDTVECPECGSNDVENDGTYNLQYECNNCGHNWGDEDKDEEYDDDDTDNYGNPIADYFEVSGVILRKSTKYDVQALGGKLVDSKYGEYKLPNGMSVMFYNNDRQANGITIDKSKSEVPEFLRSIGLYWGMDEDEFRTIFEDLGFTVSEHSSGEIWASIFCNKYKKNIYIKGQFFFNGTSMLYIRLS